MLGNSTGWVGFAQEPLLQLVDHHMGGSAQTERKAGDQCEDQEELSTLGVLAKEVAAKNDREMTEDMSHHHESKGSRGTVTKKRALQRKEPLMSDATFC